ncbi:MAG: hypothetical protein FWC76_05145 [Defluviitaleaceae bacterium]|nr:hypothetical protein [Defluviitaleaceae bacterium]
MNNNPNVQDGPSVGFMVLSIFFPVVGLILYFVWKDSQPLKAKSCGKGAIIGVIAGVVLAILFIALGACAVMMI